MIFGRNFCNANDEVYLSPDDGKKQKNDRPNIWKGFLHTIQKQADELMWHMNEKMLRQENGSLHPFDWEIEYRDINKNEFMIKIKKCGFITYADKFDARGILPGICAVDYIVAYYMKNGFHRTKTLGYGDDCCDCRYALNGSCPLKPGNGQK